jgi:hypothetical protein
MAFKVDVEELPKSVIISFAEDLFVSQSDAVTEDQRQQAKQRAMEAIKEHGASCFDHSVFHRNAVLLP